MAKNTSNQTGSKPEFHHTVEKTADGFVELQVWSIPPNPHLLICHRPEDDGSDPMKLVSVTVRSNELFVKKMRLRARQASARSFILEGPQPRWRGRW